MITRHNRFLSVMTHQALLKGSVLVILLIGSLGITIVWPQHVPPQTNPIFPERTSRDEWQKPVEIIEALALKPGETVADIGSGAGYFTGWLSQAVSAKGKVYAVDINTQAIQLLKDKLPFYPIKNIEPVLCTESDLKLPPQSLDVAFLLNTFSVVSQKETMLQNVMTALKPHGRLTIIDWRENLDGPPGPPRAQRLSERAVLEMAKAAGFKLDRRSEMLPSQYFLEFSKNSNRPNLARKR
ncbi:MAG: methyltransferase domain-containing protein [Acidobacteriia bacterium]|nr:methyltransferase domain-containing protein [Terriglobia bacterium]